jgi:hypothetical protein
MLSVIIGVVAGGLVSWILAHIYYSKQQKSSPTKFIEQIDENLRALSCRHAENVKALMAAITKTGDITTAVRDQLRSHTPPNMLLALSTLCQGYLAAYRSVSEEDGYEEDNRQSVRLTFMGWKTVKSELPECACSEEVLDEVSKPEWWTEPFAEENRSKLRQLARREYETLAVENWKIVDSLLKRILSPEAGAEKVSPDLVLGAYVAIMSVLRSIRERDYYKNGETAPN